MRVGVVAAALALALPAAAAEHTVSMLLSSYAPAALQAKVGDTIKFVNDDGENHIVFVPTVGFGVDLGAQKPGEVRMLPLRKDGLFEAECVVHPDMKMTVTVTK